MEINGYASAIGKIGIPGAIAIYLVYQMATVLPTKIDAHAKESRDEAIRQTRLLQQICLNTASTSEARTACLTWDYNR